MSESTIFISDIHLSTYHIPLQELFLQFLQGPALKAQHLYILGDLFDVCVGQDIQDTFYKKIALAFKHLADNGISLYFMAGNRDFLLQKSFLKLANIKKLPDPTIIQLYGRKTLLTHGDKLCTQDVVYQRYRKIAQHPLTKVLFLSLPKSFRANIGNKLRLKSQQYQKIQSQKILDVCPKFTAKFMQNHQVNQLIHGHVHRPCFHKVGKNTMRFVLGDWHTKASFIISTPSQMSLATFTLQEGVKIIRNTAYCNSPAPNLK